MASSKPNEPIDASDDLDDLDDILDEFNDAKKQPTQGLSASASTMSAKGPEGAAAAEGSAPIATGGDGEALREGEETEEEANERFARELAVGMEALMKGLGGGPQPPSHSAAEAGGIGDTGKEQSQSGAGVAGGNESLFSEEEMMKQFELMMKEMGLGGGANGFEGLTDAGSASSFSAAAAASPGASAPPSAPQPPANFQDAIKSTMSRLRESDATASSSSGGGADGMDLEKLMAALGGGEGMEGEEGIAKMLESMMGELMSKDVLYEPLKELKDKYPGYLANPPAPLSAEDRTRYEAQYNIVKEVVAIFDDKKFDTGTEVEKTALKAKVQTLMNEMQDNGAPPSEIVGDLPPELENMPGLGNDENCSIM